MPRISPSKSTPITAAQGRKLLRDVAALTRLVKALAVAKARPARQSRKKAA